MEKIDLKDRKILYQLDMNSRQSISAIAKKVGLSKGSVFNRIRKLEKNRVIQKYYTVIDSFKLGYISIRSLIKFQYVTKEIRNDIVNHFKNYEKIWYIAVPEGKYDLLINVWVSDIYKYYCFWNETLKKYKIYFQYWTSSVYVESHLYKHSYLLDNYLLENRKKVDIIQAGSQIKIDDLELNLLKIISSDARISFVKLAEKLNCSVKTVNTKIRKLEELKLIIGFRLNFDISKLGYKFFEISLNLRNYNDKDKIIRYMTRNPNFIMVDVTLSNTDIEVEFQCKDLNQLHEIIEDIRIKFPNAIKDYDYLYFSNLYVLNYLP